MVFLLIYWYYNGLKRWVDSMNDEEVVFDLDENIGSYYDFNLLDLIEDYDNLKCTLKKEDTTKAIKEL